MAAVSSPDNANYNWFNEAAYDFMIAHLDSEKNHNEFININGIYFKAGHN